MDGHRFCDLLDACDPPDIGQFRPCKLFFCPSLWFLAHINLQCITPSLVLGKPYILPDIEQVQIEEKLYTLR
jgi:hypothetical protein